MAKANKATTNKAVSKMTGKQILALLTTMPTVSVVIAGKILGDLEEAASYRAAGDNTLGVPVDTVGGRKRVSSLAVLRKLGRGANGEPI